MSNVCKKLGWENRWHAIDPVGRIVGLLLGWGEELTIHKIQDSAFCVEVKFEVVETNGRMWTIFLVC